MGKKKSAPTADRLGTQVDAQIRELVNAESAEAPPTGDTSAPGGTLSVQEMALLSIDRDVRTLLTIVKELQSDMRTLKAANRREKRWRTMWRKMLRRLGAR